MNKKGMSMPSCWLLAFSPPALLLLTLFCSGVVHVDDSTVSLRTGKRSWIGDSYAFSGMVMVCFTLALALERAEDELSGAVEP